MAFHSCASCALSVLLLELILWPGCETQRLPPDELRQYGCTVAEGIGDSDDSVYNHNVDAYCSFPFKYNGVTYDHCTKAGKLGESTGRYWCVTNSGADPLGDLDEAKSLGYCSRCSVLDELTAGGSGRAPGQLPQLQTISSHWLWSDLQGPSQAEAARVIRIASTVGAMDERDRARQVLTRDALRGYELYFYLVNRFLGGFNISGELYHVELVYNNASGETASKAVVQHWASEGVNLFLGSVGGVPIAEAVHDAGGLFIAPAATDPQVFENKPSAFGMSGSAVPTMKQVFQGLVAASSLDPSQYTYLIITHQHAEEKSACKHFADYLNGAGHTTVYYDSDWSVSDWEISAQQQSDLQATPHIFGGCFSTEVCGFVLKWLYKYNLNPNLILLKGCTRHLEELDPDAVALARFVVFITPWSSGQSYNCQLSYFSTDFFLRFYQEVYGQEASHISIASFLAAALLSNAIYNVGSYNDTNALIAYLQQIDTETLLGRLKFDGNGMATFPYEAVSVLGTEEAGEIATTIVPKLRGRPGLLWPRPTWQQQMCLTSTEEMVCSDTNDLAWDWRYYGCEAYEEGSECGQYDDTDFSAVAMCCECGGGKEELVHNSMGFGDVPATQFNCSICDAGKVARYVAGDSAIEDLRRLPRAVCALCSVGKYQTDITETFRECQSCPRGTYSNVEGATVCKSCKAGYYQPQLGATTCVACEPGRFSNAAGSLDCLPCADMRNIIDFSSNVVLYTSKNASSECVACPLDAECPLDSSGLYSYYVPKGGAFLLPLKEDLRYRRNGVGSLANQVDADSQLGEVFRCPYGSGEACRAGGVCAEGHGGIVCGECMEGYARGGITTICSRCPSPLWMMIYCFANGALLFVAGSVFLFFVMFINPSRPQGNMLPILRQLVNYCAIMHIIHPLVDIQMHTGLRLSDCIAWVHFFTGTDPLLMASVSSECVLAFFVSAKDTYKFYIIMGYLSWPLVLLVDVLVFCVVRAVAQAHFPAWNPPLWTLTTLCLTHTYLMHTRMLEIMAMPFRCFQYDVPRLMWNPAVVCEGDDFVAWRWVSGFGIAFIGVGMPVVILFNLYSTRRRGAMAISWEQRKLAVLTHGFETDFYSFEVVFMFRKLAFLIATVIEPLRSVQGATQTTMTLLILSCSIFFLLFHCSVMPYNNMGYFQLDRIEICMLWAITATLMLHLVTDASTKVRMVSERPNQQAALDFLQTSTFVLSLLLHVSFLGLIVHGLVQSMTTLPSIKVSEQIQLVNDGFQTRFLSKPAARLLGSLIKGTAHNVLDTEANMFHYKRFLDLLKRTFADCYYWNCMLTVHKSPYATFREHWARLMDERLVLDYAELRLFLSKNGLDKLAKYTKVLKIRHLDALISQADRLKQAMQDNGDSLPDDKWNYLTPVGVKIFRMKEESSLKKLWLGETEGFDVPQFHMKGKSTQMSARDRCLVLSARTIEGDTPLRPVVWGQLNGERLAVDELQCSLIRVGLQTELFKARGSPEDARTGGESGSRSTIVDTLFGRQVMLNDESLRSSKKSVLFGETDADLHVAEFEEVDGFRIYRNVHLPEHVKEAWMMGAEDIHDCKRECQEKGFTAFVVMGSTAKLYALPFREVEAKMAHQPMSDLYICYGEDPGTEAGDDNIGIYDEVLKEMRDHVHTLHRQLEQELVRKDATHQAYKQTVEHCSQYGFSVKHQQGEIVYYCLKHYGKAKVEGRAFADLGDAKIEFNTSEVDCVAAILVQVGDDTLEELEYKGGSGTNEVYKTELLAWLQQELVQPSCLITAQHGTELARDGFAEQADTGDAMGCTDATAEHAATEAEQREMQEIEEAKAEVELLKAELQQRQDEVARLHGELSLYDP